MTRNATVFRVANGLGGFFPSEQVFLSETMISHVVSYIAG